MRSKILKNVIFSCVVIVMLVYCGIFITAALTGKDCFYVTNGSMGKAVPLGSLIVTEPVPFDEIGKGDIVSFYDSEGRQAFTHRLVGKDEENMLLYTKGDANEIEDPVPASYDYFAGKVIIVIPLFGFISVVLHSSFGIIAVLLILLAYIAAEIYIVRKVKKKDE